MIIEKKRGFLKAMLDIVNPYAWIIAARNRAFDKGVLESRTYDIPTICIGNISVGGTGKTPHTEYLVKLLKDKYRTAILSRGYGRKSKGYVKAHEGIDMHTIGDEPFQIKNKFDNISVAVCEKRVTGMENLLHEEPELQVILLDDAYQHRYVKAGMNILLIDSNRPIWQDCILPFGRLRESISGIRRADIVIITKCNNISDKQQAWCEKYIKGIKEVPVFYSTMKYGETYPIFPKIAKKKRAGITEGMHVLLVTGIAKPEPLRKEIERQGARVTLMQYGDHHNFTAEEFMDIAEKFRQIKDDNKTIITTEKDATRLVKDPSVPQVIKENIYALPIEVEILNDRKKMFNQKIEDYVAENSRNSRIP